MAGRRLSANVTCLEADAIHHRHVDSVCDSVSALNGAPGIVLDHAELGLLRGMPTDCSGIKKHRSALQRGQAGTFRKPLIPTNQGAQAAGGGIEGTESEIARGEIKLLVIERIIWHVHLAVKPPQRSVRVEDSGGIVINPGSALLEQRCDHYDAVLASRSGEFVARWTGNRFSQIKERMIFALAEVLRLKQFRKADDLRATSGRICHAFERFCEILFRLRPAGHLDQRHTKFVGRQGVRSSDDHYSIRETASNPGVSLRENSSRGSCAVFCECAA